MEAGIFEFILSLHVKQFSQKEREDLKKYAIIGTQATTQSAIEKIKDYDNIDNDTELINYEYLFKSLPEMIQIL